MFNDKDFFCFFNFAECEEFLAKNSLQKKQSEDIFGHM